MDVKLTLKMDQNVINSMKQYAAQNGKSLSNLVEDFSKSMTSAGKKTETISPLVKELSGIISEKDLKNINYTDYLKKKYE